MRCRCLRAASISLFALIVVPCCRFGSSTCAIEAFACLDGIDIVGVLVIKVTVFQSSLIRLILYFQVEHYWFAPLVLLEFQRKFGGHTGEPGYLARSLED
jgi:hypothetical protein